LCAKSEEILPWAWHDWAQVPGTMETTMKTKRFGLVGAALALGGMLLMNVTAASADETLTYTGKDFTEVSGPSYTTSDRVTMTIDLATPLGPNLNLAAQTPSSASAFDGVQTLTLISGVQGTFDFSTDATGNITSWFVQLSEIAANPTISSVNTLGAEDFGELSGISFGIAHNPGIWTSQITAVPGPSAGAGLPGLLMAACGFLSWRRHRRNPNATDPFAHEAAA
jgi:hypothetical protein